VRRGRIGPLSQGERPTSLPPATPARLNRSERSHVRAERFTVPISASSVISEPEPGKTPNDGERVAELYRTVHRNAVWRRDS
jgi:hypothetical protein